MKELTTEMLEEEATTRHLSPTARGRLEAQGFLGYSDDFLAEVNYWLRLAPLVCTAWIAAGTYLASPAVLWALIPIAILGGILPEHPFDVIYNHGIRHLIGTRALPRYGRLRRLGCGLMTPLWVAATGWAFYSGWMRTGYVMGSVAVLLVFINVTTGLCVFSLFYGLLFGKQDNR